jgi:hypothetical protein
VAQTFKSSVRCHIDSQAQRTAPRSIHESACTGLATETRMHTYMDHLRLREEEREGKEAGESEEGKEREGEGESESTVD